MGTITSAADIDRKLMEGKGMLLPFNAGGASQTTATANSGGCNVGLCGNVVGTSFPSAVVAMPLPAGTDPLRLIQLRTNTGNSSVMGGFLANIYRVGTLNLAATGDQFTHSAATFPVTRTNVLGTDPVRGTLMLYVFSSTSAGSTVFRLRTAAGGAGYVNSQGNNVVGTKSFTLPAAGVSGGSTYYIPLEDGDGGARDVSAVEVTSSAGTGTAYIFLVEYLAPHGGAFLTHEGVTDVLWNGLDMPDLRPAAATSGSLISGLHVFTSYLAGAGTCSGSILAVTDA